MVQKGFIFTDRGNPLQAVKFIKGDEEYRNNCHGFTFGTSDMWIISGIATLLMDEGYKQVSIPEVNDVAIYWDWQGFTEDGSEPTYTNGIVHSGIVVQSDKNGIRVASEGGYTKGTMTTSPEGAYSLPQYYEDGYIEIRYYRQVK
ncbi:MAG: hypothetical protein OEV59_05230 [Deltaproteobacteria bacterium]|nr:hypothetical protein [Deltaproteobacteria bacterium]